MNDNNIEMLMSVIPIGKENAIHQVELAERIGTTPDIAKVMVREARQRGMRILSSNRGYWIPENDEEVKQFVWQMLKQAYTRIKSVGCMRSVLNEVSGQMSLSDVLKELSEEDENNGKQKE